MAAPTSSPVARIRWSISINTAAYANGSHNLKARATDSAGNQALGGPDDHDQQRRSPTVSITSPAAGATVSGTLTVSGTASTRRLEGRARGGQRRLPTREWHEFLVDLDQHLGLRQRQPHADGQGDRLVRQAELGGPDGHDQQRRSSSVSISSPAAGATVSGTITVSGAASARSKVELQVDSGAYQLASGTSSWSKSINTASYANGSHTLTARATNSAGTQVWASRTVTISNGGSPAWTNVLNDQFDSGGVPTHWKLYDFRYGTSGNCASPSHNTVSGGYLRLLMRYETTGKCGAGWYTGGMSLAKVAPYASVDQRITVRFRVAYGGVIAHHIIPMRWPTTATQPGGGEEDYCESHYAHVLLDLPPRQWGGRQPPILLRPDAVAHGPRRAAQLRRQGLDRRHGQPGLDLQRQLRRRCRPRSRRPSSSRSAGPCGSAAVRPAPRAPRRSRSTGSRSTTRLELNTVGQALPRGWRRTCSIRAGWFMRFLREALSRADPPLVEHETGVWRLK